MISWRLLNSSNTIVASHLKRIRPSVFDLRSSAAPSLYLRSAMQHRSFSKGNCGGGANDPFALEKETWAEKHLPPSVLPYIQLARLNRPVGTMMLLWPCYWSLALAAPAGALPDPSMLALFGVGAVLMRSAGCTINDIVDQDFDKQVERTNKRPLAAGTLTTPQAVTFLAGQLSASLAVLLQLNTTCLALGASSLVLVGSYPFMKRFTYWPQAFLGLTFNWGALMGYAAVHDTVAWNVVLPLYAGGVAWTIVYDTLYAHQDKEDDKKIGVKSTALLFGENKTVPILSGFAAAAVTGFTAAGYAADLSWPFYAGMAAASTHLGWQIKTADLANPENLRARFNSNSAVGALVFSSIVLGNVF